MPIINKDLDSTFQTAVSNPYPYYDFLSNFFTFWCIENQLLVRESQSNYCKFYTGSAYIVLDAVYPKNDPPQYDVHYWLGNDKKRIQTWHQIELDTALGSCSVQYREIQGQKSQKLL